MKKLFAWWFRYRINVMKPSGKMPKRNIAMLWDSLNSCKEKNELIVIMEIAVLHWRDFDGGFGKFLRRADQVKRAIEFCDKWFKYDLLSQGIIEGAIRVAKMPHEFAAIQIHIGRNVEGYANEYGSHFPIKIMQQCTSQILKLENYSNHQNSTTP